MSQQRPASLVALALVGVLAAGLGTAWLALSHLEARLWAAAIVGLAGLGAWIAVLQGHRRPAAIAGLILVAGLLLVPTGIEDLSARITGGVVALAAIMALETGDLLLRLRETDPTPPPEVVAASTRALVGRVLLLALLVAGVALVGPLFGASVLPPVAAMSTELWTPWSIVALAGILGGLLVILGVLRRRGTGGPPHGVDR